MNAIAPYDADDVRTWVVWTPLAAHAEAVSRYAEAAVIAGPTARLMSQLGLFWNARGRFRSAEPLMRRALAIVERSYGPDHPDVAIRLNNLAQLLQATDRLDEAEPLMRQALAIDERSYGPDHPDVAIDLNNLATLLQATDRLDEAEPLMRQALAIDERSLGTDHPDVATDLNNLAMLLQATDRLDEAEPLYRRSAKILIEFQRQTEYEHPRIWSCLANYRNLLQAMGKTQEEIEQQLNELTGSPHSEGS